MGNVRLAGTPPLIVVGARAVFVGLPNLIALVLGQIVQIGKQPADAAPGYPDFLRAGQNNRLLHDSCRVPGYGMADARTLDCRYKRRPSDLILANFSRSRECFLDGSFLLVEALFRNQPGRDLAQRDHRGLFVLARNQGLGAVGKPARARSGHADEVENILDPLLAVFYGNSRHCICCVEKSLPGILHHYACRRKVLPVARPDQFFDSRPVP